MFCVYEVCEGKNDLFRFEHKDRFMCEVWCDHHIYEHPTIVRNFEIREEQ